MGEHFEKFKALTHAHVYSWEGLGSEATCILLLCTNGNNYIQLHRCVINFYTCIYILQYVYLGNIQRTTATAAWSKESMEVMSTVLPSLVLNSTHRIHLFVTELTCRRQGVILYVHVNTGMYIRVYYNSRCVSKCIYDVCGFSGFLHVHCI